MVDRLAWRTLVAELAVWNSGQNPSGLAEFNVYEGRAALTKPRNVAEASTWSRRKVAVDPLEALATVKRCGFVTKSEQP